MEIKFTPISTVGEFYKPQPASTVVPDWYKGLDSYLIDNKKIPAGDGTTTGTIKRCMPVFDAISAGYILFTPVDVYVTQRKDPNTKAGTAPWYEWPSLTALQFHPIEQAPNHPKKGGHELSYPKWMNQWGVKTPPGYSSLFVQPFHRDSVFTIFPGVVDTDKYFAPINFPFVLDDYSFEGLIPAGTPMAQVIPFKRESWDTVFGSQEDLQELSKVSTRLKVKIFDSYKVFYRSKKEFK
jgi:hypothetical protein